jgi:hypothetical protein
MAERAPNGEREERIADLEAKVDGLRRANAELGREVRRGGVSPGPRSPLSAARALAKLTNERDQAKVELEETRARLRAVDESFAGLRVETEHLRSEANRLRSGRLGVLRRIRARLLRR